MSDAGAKRVCEAPTCPEVIPMGMLMCRGHWAMIPADLQRKIYKLYHQMRRGENVIEAYKEAVCQAVQHVGGGRRRRGGATRTKQGDLLDA